MVFGVDRDLPFWDSGVGTTHKYYTQSPLNVHVLMRTPVHPPHHVLHHTHEGFHQAVAGKGGKASDV